MEASVTADSTHAGKPRRRMSTRNRILFFATAWLIVLMPFLFWWNTWFGRALSDKQLAVYLQDDAHPRHIQHALVQVGERIARHDPAVTQWYPRVAELSSYRVEQVRNTDAWVMGQDTSVAVFHEKLLTMLSDSAPTVRGNAALSLVRFGDATGRPQILELLEPATISAPHAGKIVDASAAGTPVRQGGVVAKISSGNQTTEVRSPIGGRLRFVASAGKSVDAGVELAVIDPGTEQVWEALRALYLVGQRDDLAAIQPYTRETSGVADHVRQQALLTEQAIRAR